ncbi:MAG TPA: mandelate racemase/muconate lactonizing enzyme family protein [Candidatus Acidoferrum sp.]|nr:mandelate racemase/muconate lactonizing enzyme family protein [Candidatus Acidoferrum sp.]
MKITALETILLDEFPNLLWVQVHTDAGHVGIGETFYGARAVEAHIHETLAPRLLGADPLRIEYLNALMTTLPVAQSSTGVEYRAASAVDIALWDLFGKHCGQPVHQMLGGACFDRLPVYNTCAGYKYVRSGDFRALANWNPSDTAGPYEDLDAFMHRADALAESLLESGITAMKIWPFDVAARETGGRYITSAQLSTCLAPFEKIRKAVGNRMEIMVEFHSLWNLPTALKIAKELEAFKPMWFEDPIVMNSPQALAEYARSTNVWVCASETLGSRWPYKDFLDRDAMHVVMVDLSWAGGLTEGRKIASMAATYHRPFAAHDCIGPVSYAAAIHMAFSQPNTLIQESVRAFYTGYYRELVTVVPDVVNGFICPMEGTGLGTELLPSVFNRRDVHRRRVEL